MDIAAIYQPVHQELREVEKQFKLIIESERGFPNLYEMLRHVLTGGKVIRPALNLLAGKFYSYDPAKLLHMATASELLHIATLVHDDAIDKSEVRRWRQTVNKLWGADKAILLGDYLFAKAGEFSAATENVRAVRLFTQTLATISSGEMKQSFDAFKLEQTRDDYMKRISRKTASLFTMATETGAILSQAPEQAIDVLREYGYNLGIAFQIVDDILDFIGTEREMGKPIGSDLAQGTLTLPAIILVERHPQDNPVKHIFCNEDRQRDIKLAIDMIQSSSIIEECYQAASQYGGKACESLRLLPDNDIRRALEHLVDFVISRKT
ncbi:MAG: polyprenyl synthetase family protein [Chloroflexi bacterium]|nr:polyprenyl synthetase family protein [Chloroflexota bacterium]